MTLSGFSLNGPPALSIRQRRSASPAWQNRCTTGRRTRVLARRECVLRTLTGLSRYSSVHPDYA
jgi:hypothetical protein